ncbi:MAG: MFS transporter [Firmicutes bacterium]|nr:MFS transporter [Bacillota bacterium]
MTSLMTTFNSSSLNLSIPNIEAEFGVSAQLIGWVVTIYALASVSLSIPFGKIADITDRVRVLRTGVVLFGIGVGLCLFSVNFTMFMLCRLLQGIGAAMIFATSNAILIGAFDISERGKMLGLSICATYIGLSTGPVVGGLVNSLFGWRAVMMISGAFTLLVVCSSFTKISVSERIPLREWAPLFDLKAALLYAVSLASLMYGLSLIGSSSLCLPLTIVGLVLGFLFIRYQIHAEEPVLKVSLFKDRAFAFSNLSAFLNYASTFAVTYFMSIYLQLVKGFPSGKAGLIMIATPLVQAALSPITGRLSDKHSPYKLSSAGMGFCAISLLLISTIQIDTEVYVIIPILMTMGLGFALFSSPNTNIIMSAVPPEDRGVTSSISATMRNAGQTTGMAVLTVIIGSTMGSLGLNQASPELIVHTMHIAFRVFSLTCFAGIFISLQRKKK